MTTPTITPIDATGLLWSLALLLADHPDADRHQLALDIGGLFEGILGEGPDRAVVADVVETAAMLLDALDQRHTTDSSSHRPFPIFTGTPETSGECLHPGSPPADPATKPGAARGRRRPACHGLLWGLTACVLGVLGWLWGGRR